MTAEKNGYHYYMEEYNKSKELTAERDALKAANAELIELLDAAVAKSRMAQFMAGLQPVKESK